MSNGNAAYRGKLLLSFIAAALLYMGVSRTEVKPENKEPTVALQDIGSKVDEVYRWVLLNGSQSTTNQGTLYELDAKNYIVDVKADTNDNEKKEFLLIFSKPKDNRIGFYDQKADGIPEVYVSLNIYPKPGELPEITDELMEFLKSGKNQTSTNIATYFRLNPDIPDNNKAKYEPIIDGVIKDEMK